MIAFLRFALKMFLSRQLTVGQRITAINYLIKTKVFKKGLIRSVEFFHTLRCNCHCPFCSEPGLCENAIMMKKTDVINGIKKLADHGVVSVIFIGGESLTDPDIYDYISYTRKLNMIPQLQTNGTLLTEENIYRLVNAGLYSISITLYDTLNSTHDATVGMPGALARIKSAVPVLKLKRVEVVLKTIYSRQIVESGAYDRVLDLARSFGISVNINPLMPVGRAVPKDMGLSATEKKEYLKRTLNDPIVTTHTKGALGNECPATGNYIGIFPDGEITPCGFLPISVGNIKNTSISVARQRCIDLGIFRKGIDACVVALSRPFYDQFLTKLYSGDYALPVRIYEHPELLRVCVSLAALNKSKNVDDKN